MEKERVMKHAVPLTEIQKQMFDMIETALKDQEALLSDEEVMNFWKGIHQELKLCEEVSQKDEAVTFLYEEPIQEGSKKEQQWISDEVVIDPIDGIKEFFNVPIRVLFLGIMSLNILWMEVLSRNYGNHAVINLMEYSMILMVIGFLLSWIKPEKKVFWKISGHD